MQEEKWALISVYNKNGVVDFAKRLVKMGWHILASGGTAKVLSEAGIQVKDVAEMVGPPILGDRVKTLSRELHAGLLANALKLDDLAELVSLHIPFINLVRCDFYPLAEAIADPKATIASVVEKTDIGGPCMVRSGAKGLRTVISRQEDAEAVLQELEKNGTVSYDTRQKLRARAEFEVTKYTGDSAMYHGAGQFKVITGEKVSEFKGENAPQTPAYHFSAGTDDPLALDKFTVIAGVPPSHNNWCDVDRLLQTMTHLAAAHNSNFGWTPSIGIGAKHGNPCGAGVASPRKVWDMMIKGDTRAIRGGVIMTNFTVDGDVANAMAQAMPGGKAKFDGVIAPGFDYQAIQTLSRVKGRCRLMVNPALAVHSTLLDTRPRFRYVRGGFMVQPAYTFLLDFNHPEMKVYGTRSASREKDVLVAWGIGCTSNSNTITIVNNGMLISNGVGQQDRVGAAELAVKRAKDAGHKDKLAGAVAYSDSFFPFTDAVQVLIDAGIQSIFSTSGSELGDAKVEDLCVRNKVTLYQLPDVIARGFYGH